MMFGNPRFAPEFRLNLGINGIAQSYGAQKYRKSNMPPWDNTPLLFLCAAFPLSS